MFKVGIRDGSVFIEGLIIDFILIVAAGKRDDKKWQREEE